MDSEVIQLAYSPDTDDAFMFWALKAGRIDTHGLRFAHTRADTDALNRKAETGDTPHVCAISIHQYAYISRRYLLLPHGGSVGAGYGPVLVTREPTKLADLSGARIGVPGLRTTAYLVLRLLLPDFDAVLVPVAPFTRAQEVLEDGSVDAVLMIHEGRLLYESWGLSAALEIGEAWKALTGGPLPLGGNAIRRDLGEERIALISSILRESIRYGLQHREEVMTDLLALETRAAVPKDRSMFDRYLGMYANADTLDYGEEGRAAIVDLLNRGREAGVITEPVQVEFSV